nr:hypothetical protein CFP56_00604 [Quercus suber]
MPQRPACAIVHVQIRRRLDQSVRVVCCLPVADLISASLTTSGGGIVPRTGSVMPSAVALWAVPPRQHSTLLGSIDAWSHVPSGLRDLGTRASLVSNKSRRCHRPGLPAGVGREVRAKSDGVQAIIPSTHPPPPEQSSAPGWRRYPIRSAVAVADDDLRIHQAGVVGWLRAGSGTRLDETLSRLSFDASPPSSNTPDKCTRSGLEATVIRLSLRPVTIPGQLEPPRVASFRLAGGYCSPLESISLRKARALQWLVITRDAPTLLSLLILTANVSRIVRGHHKVHAKSIENCMLRSQIPHCSGVTSPSSSSAPAHPPSLLLNLPFFGCWTGPQIFSLRLLPFGSSTVGVRQPVPHQSGTPLFGLIAPRHYQSSRYTSTLALRRIRKSNDQLQALVETGTTSCKHLKIKPCTGALRDRDDLAVLSSMSCTNSRSSIPIRSSGRDSFSPSGSASLFSRFRPISGPTLDLPISEHHNHPRPTTFCAPAPYTENQQSNLQSLRAQTLHQSSQQTIPGSFFWWLPPAFLRSFVVAPSGASRNSPDQQRSFNARTVRTDRPRIPPLWVRSSPKDSVHSARAPVTDADRHVS